MRTPDAFEYQKREVDDPQTPGGKRTIAVNPPRHGVVLPDLERLRRDFPYHLADVPAEYVSIHYALTAQEVNAINAVRDWLDASSPPAAPASTLPGTQLYDVAARPRP